MRDTIALDTVKINLDFIQKESIKSDQLLFQKITKARVVKYDLMHWKFTHLFFSLDAF